MPKSVKRVSKRGREGAHVQCCLLFPPRHLWAMLPRQVLLPQLRLLLLLRLRRRPLLLVGHERRELPRRQRRAQSHGLALRLPARHARNLRLLSRLLLLADRALGGAQPLGTQPLLRFMRREVRLRPHSAPSHFAGHLVTADEGMHNLRTQLFHAAEASLHCALENYEYI